MIQASRNVGIIGTGSYVPEKVLTNLDLEKIVDTSDEWIRTRTGITERHIAASNETAVDFGEKAARKALDVAGLAPEEIDLIIFCTVAADYYSPSSSCMIQARLGAKKAAAFDLNAACSGFTYGMTTASQFILTGYYKNALIIGAECLSRITDWTDRNTCVLFADGAGAAVLSQVEHGYGILSTQLGADGTSGGYLTIPSLYVNEEEKAKRTSGNYRTVWMDGSEVFKFAVKVLSSATKEALAEVNLTTEDVNLVVPHQANIRIIEGASKRLGIPMEKFFTNLHKYGNMSAASIPVALDEAVREGRINKGDIIVAVGFGGGLTWGSAIIKWAI